MALYHREVFWKDWFDSSAYKLICNPMDVSHHLCERMEESAKRRDFNVDTLTVALKKVYNEMLKPFEVEVQNGKVVKAVYRVGLDDADISIVIRYGFIQTAWLNKKDDKHFTLDVDKYSKV